MENTATYKLSISDIKEHFPSSHRVEIGDEFCIVNVCNNENRRFSMHPFRFDGVMVLYCIKGGLRVSVNLNDFEVLENTMFMSMPNNILRFSERDEKTEDSHYVLVAMSPQFASDLRVDFKKFLNEGLFMMEDPVVEFDDMEKELMSRHMELISKVAGSDMSFRETSVRSLVSSMFCLAVSLWDKKIDQTRQNASDHTTRSRMVFEQFIKLVGEYHIQHRNVGFYADKMCLTPKYLSKLIKTISGRSAPEWIDSYVILEARSLLKYSDATIKEIVYKLNFPNQSVFYKFFKARTGMTPSEYRKS